MKLKKKKRTYGPNIRLLLDKRLPFFVYMPSFKFKFEVLLRGLLKRNDPPGGKKKKKKKKKQLYLSQAKSGQFE